MTPAADEPQIDSDTGPVTLVNIFEIDSAKLELFFAEWHRRAEFMTRQRGFRSLKLHRAVAPDARLQLVNVADGNSAEALHAATAQQYFQQSTRRSAQDVGMTAHPAIYRVAFKQQTLND